MPATTLPRERRPVTLMHVVKERLRSAMSQSPTSDSTDSITSTPNTRLSHTFPESSSAVSSRHADPSVTATSTPDPRPRRWPRPDALPTVDFYERFPRAVGPLANVVVTSFEEYKMLLLTAQPITIVRSRWERNVTMGQLCEEDVLKGGFLVYQPQSENPKYFKLRQRAADVYGSSVYISG